LREDNPADFACGNNFSSKNMEFAIATVALENISSSAATTPPPLTIVVA